MEKKPILQIVKKDLTKKTNKDADANANAENDNLVPEAEKGYPCLQLQINMETMSVKMLWANCGDPAKASLMLMGIKMAERALLENAYLE